jgi:hypothetical protein
VSIDGATIPPAALIAYRRVNPGSHVVLARAGATERQLQVKVAEREKREVTIDLGAAGPGSIVEAPSSAPPEEAMPGPSHAPWTALAFLGFGTGVAGIAVGSVTGLVSISKANAAKSIPPSQGGCVGNQCGPATHSDIDASVALGDVSTVAFVVGGAGVALGVASLFLRREPPKPATGTRADPSRGVSLSPWLGPFGGGVSGSF